MNGADSEVSAGARKQIKKALLIALIAIGVQLVILLINLIYNILFLRWSNRPYSDSIVTIYHSENIIHYLTIGAFFILLMVWLVLYYRSSKELGERARRMIAWSIAIFGAYVLVYFIYWFTISPSIFSLAMYDKIGYGWYEGLNAFVWLIHLSALMMVFILPLQPISSRKIGWIALIAGIIFILATNSVAGNLWEDLGAKMAGSDPFKAYYYVQIFIYFPLVTGIYLMIGLAYFLTFRRIMDFDIKRTSWEARRKDGKLAKGSLKKAFDLTDRNPYRFLVFIVAISLIYGIIMGVRADDPFQRSWSSSYEEWYPEYSEGSYTTAFDGYIDEGEEITETIGVYSDVTYIIVQLTWNDESDLRGRENQGDSFEMEVDANGMVENGGGTNSHGNTGVVELHFDEIGYVSDLNIMIRLTNAGDQQLVFGPGILTWSDNGNDYEVYVEIGYMGYT